MKRKNKIQFTETSPIYTTLQIGEVLACAVGDGNLRGTNKGVYYYDVPCAFDIETTSFYRIGSIQYTYEDTREILRKNPKAKFEKCAIMYVWQFGINGRVVMGRTWSEFIAMCKTIATTLGLNTNRRLVVYVHNLAYEFQFLRHYFEWDKVFAIDERKPIYATTKLFIEFRCSYLLTGYSLAKLGEQLQKYKVEKMVGDLDYSKIRHSETPLTEKEIGYCVNDVRVVMAAIQEKIENERGITHIPLTKTGYVRKHGRGNCLYIKDGGKRHPNHRYFDMMAELQIKDTNEFNAMQRAFQGGFTHANANHTGQIIDNVASYDFTSSYPYVMVSEQYPMTHGLKVRAANRAEFEHYINNYCVIMDVTFHGLMAYETQDTPLSVSKCFARKNVVENNGRVFSATEVSTTITNIDYKVLRAFYRWDTLTVGDMYVYRRGYLPTEFVRTILELYSNKTTLKGVRGKEVEYLQSKEMVNACYGMTVTNPLRDEFVYNGVWGVEELTPDQKAEMLFKYNHSQNRFLFYPWGVFVTAYARRNLFTAIYTLKDDYIYSDTDSVKVINHEAHRAYFDAYNREVEMKLKRACAFHGIPFELCEPKTIKGVTKRLGVWDFEGVYKRFKTLGAKRYIVQEKDALFVDGKSYGYSLTVAGLNKFVAIPYLLAKYGDGIMDAFSDNLYIPPCGTGKNLHTYIDYPIAGVLTDYYGKPAPYKEESGVHLEPTDYTLNLSLMYLDFISNNKKYK